MAHVDALSRASVEADGAVLDDILADQYSVCVSLIKMERVAMCQAADEEVKDIKRLVLQSTSPSKEDDHFFVTYFIEDLKISCCLSCPRACGGVWLLPLMI